jgi:hypothetical protein
MDTDCLTSMAYETLNLAYDVLDVLHSEIGASAEGCCTEEEFLRGVKKHLQDILSAPRDYLDFWNYLETVDMRQFKAGIQGLLAHVEKTLSTPCQDRGASEYI